MGFLKSFFGAMAAAEVNERKRAEKERVRTEREGLNNAQKVLKLSMDFLDYQKQINCRHATFREIVSEYDIDNNNVTSYDVIRTEQLFNGYKRQLKQFMSYGGDPSYIYEYDCDSNKMDLYIEIVRKLKEYGWLDKQEKYVKFAEDTYWLDQDLEKEKKKREWLSELFTLSSNELKQVLRKNNNNFVPYENIDERGICISGAYYLPQTRDAGIEMFDSAIAVKFTDNHIIFYDNDTREEMYYKSNISNSSVQMICTKFTSDLTAVDLNGIYIIINAAEVKQVQCFYDKHNARVANENRQAYEGIDTLSGVEFERVCKRLLENMGFRVETTKASGDGGIDLIAYNSQPLLSGKYIIQCKRYSGSVGEPIIRDLYGVVTSERANKGILITTGRFTKSAVSFAADKPIELMDGTQLKELIARYLGTENISASFEHSAIIDEDVGLATKGSPIAVGTALDGYNSVQKKDKQKTNAFVHNSSVTAILGKNNMNSQNFIKWESNYKQNPSDLKAICKLTEILHNAIIGRISDSSVSNVDFRNSVLQLSNLNNVVIEKSKPGVSRQEDYRYYMACAVAGECDFWTGNIVDAIIKWDNIAYDWAELSGDTLFCSNFRGDLLASVVSCLEIMGCEDIAEKYRIYWNERLTTENVELQEKGLLFTVFGNNDAVEKMEACVYNPTLVGFVIGSFDDSSGLMCENGMDFSALEAWCLEKNGGELVIREKDSSVSTQILKDLNGHVSARSGDIVSHFGDKYI